MLTVYIIRVKVISGQTTQKTIYTYLQYQISVKIRTSDEARLRSNSSVYQEDRPTETLKNVKCNE